MQVAHRIMLPILVFAAIRGVASLLVRVGAAPDLFSVFAALGYLWIALVSYSVGAWIAGKLEVRTP